VDDVDRQVRELHGIGVELSVAYELAHADTDAKRMFVRSAYSDSDRRTGKNLVKYESFIPTREVTDAGATQTPSLTPPSMTSSPQLPEQWALLPATVPAGSSGGQPPVPAPRQRKRRSGSRKRQPSVPKSVPTPGPQVEQ
jgi:hypothetical protein